MSEQDTLKQVLSALEAIDRRLTALEARPVVQPFVTNIRPNEGGSDPWIPTEPVTYPSTGDPLPDLGTTICGPGSLTCSGDDKYTLMN